MIPVLAALLVLHPVVAADSDLRLAATGPAPVAWTLDGRDVGTTDGNAIVVHVPAGAHEVTASGHSRAPWTAMARLDQDAAGLQLMPSWSAMSPGEAPRTIPSAWLPLAALGLVAAAHVRQARSKGP